MIWFLRLFRAYRDLEAELAIAAARAIEADDRVRLIQSRYAIVLEERDKSRADHERDIKTVANYEARRAGAQHVPYPDVEAQAYPLHEVPAENLHLTPPPYHRSLREFQQDAVMKSRAAAASRRMAINGDVED